MRFKIALVVALNLVLVGSLHAAERVIPAEWVNKFVNIRESPSVDSPIVGRLDRDEVADLLESLPLWYKIELDGLIGYVSKSWADVVRDLDPRETDELRIHFLNIGAGVCTVVECPGQNAPPMIVDCGTLGETQADLDADEARAYIDNIIGDAPTVNLVLSHAHTDHYGSIPHVLAGVTLGHVWQGGDPDGYSRDGFPAWIAAREAEGVSIHNDFPPHWHNDGEALGSDLSCGDANTFVLTVNTPGDTPNGQSLVLLIEYKDFTVILPGDAEGVTEARAITNFDGAVHATVLSSSHHGSNTHGSNGSGGNGWADATRPAVTVFSAGREFRHPKCTSVQRYEPFTTDARKHPAQCGKSQYGPVYRTKEAEYMTEVVGTVIVTTNGKSPLLVQCSRSAECYSEIAF